MRSPTKGPAAKSRRRLITCAASALLRAVPRRRNAPPSGGENVWATGASTFGIGRQPLELRAKGTSRRLFRPRWLHRFHWSRYGGRWRPQAPRRSSPIVGSPSVRHANEAALKGSALVQPGSMGFSTQRRGTRLRDQQPHTSPCNIEEQARSGLLRASQLQQGTWNDDKPPLRVLDGIQPSQKQAHMMEVALCTRPSISPAG
jgi:hypothetical protein